LPMWSRKKAVALAKQSVCDERGRLVDAADDTANASQQVSAQAQQKVEAFSVNKSEMLMEQESFTKLISDDFQSLKEGTWQGHHSTKAKVIGELKKKLLDIGSQQSLADALAAALKLKPEQRSGAFAKAAMGFVEECFANHAAKVAQDISALDSEEGSLKHAVVLADAELAEKKGELQRKKKEWDELQDVWVKLEEDAAEASRSAKRLELEMPKLTKAVEKAKLELEKFLELPSLFARLRAQSTAAPEEPCADEEVVAEDETADAETADENSQAIC